MEERANRHRVSHRGPRGKFVYFSNLITSLYRLHTVKPAPLLSLWVCLWCAECWKNLHTPSRKRLRNHKLEYPPYPPWTLGANHLETQTHVSFNAIQSAVTSRGSLAHTRRLSILWRARTHNPNGLHREEGPDNLVRAASGSKHLYGSERGVVCALRPESGALRQLACLPANRGKCQSLVQTPDRPSLSSLHDIIIAGERCHKETNAQRKWLREKKKTAIQSADLRQLSCHCGAGGAEEIIQRYWEAIWCFGWLLNWS